MGRLGARAARPSRCARWDERVTGGGGRRGWPAPASGRRGERDAPRLLRANDFSRALGGVDGEARLAVADSILAGIAPTAGANCRANHVTVVPGGSIPGQQEDTLAAGIELCQWPRTIWSAYQVRTSLTPALVGRASIQRGHGSSLRRLAALQEQASRTSQARAVGSGPMRHRLLDHPLRIAIRVRTRSAWRISWV